MLDAITRLNSNILTAKKDDSERIILPLAPHPVTVIKKLTGKNKEKQEQ